MTKLQLLKKIDTAWEAFQESYRGLSDVEMQKSGVTSDWSVKDIIAHVTTWENEALKHLPHIIKGETPPKYSEKYGGINAFNALMTERKKDLMLTDLLKEQAKTHRRLKNFVKDLPDEQIRTETKARRRIRLDCYGHYQIHASAISEWRTKTRV